MWPGFSGGENIYGSCRAHEMIQNPRALPSLAVQIKDIRSVWLLLAPSFQGLSPCHPSCSRWHHQVPLPGDTARSQVPVPGVTLRCQVLLAGASPMCHSQVQGATSRCHSQVPGATLRSQVLLPGATSGSQVPLPGPKSQVPLPGARCHSQMPGATPSATPRSQQELLLLLQVGSGRVLSSMSSCSPIQSAIELCQHLPISSLCYVSSSHK